MPGPQLSSDPRDSRSNRVGGRSALASILAALGACLLFAGFGPGVSTAAAAPTEMVDLGTASTYGVFSGASVANTVSAEGAPHTTIRGDLGVKVDAEPAGFPPGVVTGATNVGDSAAIQAHAHLVAAYNEVQARNGATVLPLALAGQTLVPGLYKVPGAASNTGTVTLDAEGDPNAVFVIQVTGALSFASLSQVVLTGQARASRVFWQVNGAADVGANGVFTGTLMALDALAMGNGVLVNGRLLALNGALGLDNNEIYSAPPVVTISGGASASTTDTTPTISGTTDVEAPGQVTVTVAGQTLAATPSNGAWSVTSAILANATYPVVASVTDGAGNPGSFTQQLTVDTVLPVVTIDGGPSAATNDSSPTITGTSDAAPGTILTVSIAGQTLTTLVQTNGTWNTTPAHVADGTWTVIASAPDPAGNVGSAEQTLVIGPEPPADTPPPGGGDSAPAVGEATVSGNASQRVRGSSLSIRTTVTAPAASGVLATASGPVRIRGTRKPVRLATSIVRVGAGQSGLLMLRAKGNRAAGARALRQIKAAIASHRRVLALIAIKLVDDAGNARLVTKRVLLRR